MLKLVSLYNVHNIHFQETYILEPLRKHIGLQKF